MESELFGHVKGAFTGAANTKIGLIEAANGGTAFFDEIGELPLDLQAKLLRVLQEKEFRPVGSLGTRRSDFRIIAATNRDLAKEVEKGTFRRDLYYRLHVINFHLPPLRHRPEDIGPLVRGMVARYGTKYGKKFFSVSPDALHALESFPWPGNIRQLENVVQQAVLTGTGTELKLHHLPPAMHAHTEQAIIPMPTVNGYGAGTLKQNRETNERSNIVRALEKAGQSRTRAAQILGVSRVTLYKKMKKYGLLPKTNGSGHASFFFTGKHFSGTE